MLWEWDQGLRRLNDRITVQVPNIVEQATAAGIKQVPRAAQHVPARFGESPLLASRRRKKVTLAS
jgi:serine/threonine-protein kinase HipA